MKAFLDEEAVPREPDIFTRAAVFQENVQRSFQANGLTYLRISGTKGLTAMNELVNSIKKQTEVLFVNADIMLKTCDLDFVLCDMSVLKQPYAPFL